MSSINDFDESPPLIPQPTPSDQTSGELANHKVTQVSDQSNQKSLPEPSAYQQIAYQQIAYQQIAYQQIACLVSSVAKGILLGLSAIISATRGTYLASQALGSLLMGNIENSHKSLNAAWGAINSTFQAIVDPSDKNLLKAIFGDEIKEVQIQKSDGVTTLFQDHTTAQHQIKEGIGFDSKNWVDCNYTRRSYKEASSFEDYKNNLESKIPNLAIHEVKVKPIGQNNNEVKIFGCVRSGAITDARYGAFSIKDLKQLHELKNNANEFNEKLNSIENKIISLKDKANKKGNQKAVEYLDASSSYLTSLRGDPNKSTELLNERIKRLQPQFFQLLTKHIENSDASKLSENSSFGLAEVGLIHAEAKIESEGILHDEKVMQEDTQAMLSLFNGSSIQVSNEANQIGFDDNSKTIIVPRQMFQGLPTNVNNLKLNSFYMNISIQKNRENTEDQKTINREAFHAMGRENLGVSEELEKKILNSDELSQREAIDLLESFEEKGLSLGVMCYSGKDRTGFVVAQLAKRITEKKLGSPVESMGEITSQSLAVSVADYNLASLSNKLEITEGSEPEIYIPNKMTYLKLELGTLDTLTGKVKQAVNFGLGLLKGQSAAD